MRVLLSTSLLFLLAGSTWAPAATVTLEEFSLPADSYDNGHPSGPNNTLPGSLPNGVTDGSFSHAGVTFANTFEIDDFGGSTKFGFWDGWALSSKTDTTTPGFPNQYSAIPGTGADNSATYGVAFDGARIELDAPHVVEGAFLTNTVYAYRAITDGDTGGFQDPDPFAEGDWFLLTITGLDATDAPVGTLEYYLADYRSADSSQHYAIDDWDWLDMTSLGAVSALEFSFSGSDNDPVFDFLNTPSYVALDDFTLAVAVPEPATASFTFAAMLCIWLAWRRRFSRTSRWLTPRA